jgi:hypothetical protein
MIYFLEIESSVNSAMQQKEADTQKQPESESTPGEK